MPINIGVIEGSLNLVDQLSGPLSRASDKLNQFSSNTIARASSSIKSASTSIQQSFDGISAKVKSATADLEKSGQKIEKFGRQITSVGSQLSRTISLPIIGVGVAATKMATDLNSSLANVSALLTDLSGRDLEQTVNGMKSKVQALAVDMGKSTTDISGGLYEVISSLGLTNDTFGQVAISAKAGAAGLATTQQAFSFLSAVTKTYGDTSEAAFKKVGDLGFQAVNLGQTTFP